MATKLCQINALVTGRKGEIEKTVGDLYKLLQKPALFDGLTREYKPLDEFGEKIASEIQKVQYSVRGLREQVEEKWTELWDLTLTQDTANQSAKADVKVDGVVILHDVPVTNLLFLEKQVEHLKTFVTHYPTPASTENWTYDPNTSLLRSEVSTTMKSKKKPASFEKSPATKEHPAQVEFYHEDVNVGTWTTTKFSAAVPADEKTETLKRVKKLQDAIKMAREEANLAEVKPQKAGEAIFDFVFRPKTK